MRTCCVTLIDFFSYIDVHVKAPTKAYHEACPMIQKSIVSGIEAAFTKLHYSNDHPHLAIFCPHTTDAVPFIHAAPLIHAGPLI